MNAKADGYRLNKEQDIGIVSEDVPIKYLSIIKGKNGDSAVKKADRHKTDWK